MDNQEWNPVPEGGGEQSFPPEEFRDEEFREAFGEGADLASFFADEPTVQLPELTEQPREPEQPEQPREPEAPAQPPEEKNETMKKKTKKKTSDEAIKKGRPKRKRGYGLLGIPHIVATAVWLAIIAVIGVTAGRMIWLCATDILAFGREPVTATVIIEQDDPMDVVANKLKKAGLIRYTGLFEFYADLTDAGEKIRAGTYEFNPPGQDEEMVVYDYMALVSKLTPGSMSGVVEDLRIPEGYTCNQIFRLLEEKNVCTVEELTKYVEHADLGEYWFLEDLNGVQPRATNWLEGYLFPNTYDFYVHDDPERVIKKMLNAFESNYTEAMRAELNNLNKTLEEMMREHGYGEDYIEKHKFTHHDVMIVASMIEKETANNTESFTISSVIYNRLCNAGEFPYLNIDATLVYILDGKAELTKEDLMIDDPYNTYVYKGLPPGPISNPSQNSISAALKPESSEYYFYVYDPETLEHHFSKTLKEHEAFIEKLRNAS